VLLRSEQSGGEVAVIEGSTHPPGFAGPPLHLHDFDEAFYVLEGELTFRLSDELFTRRAGELAFAPRGVPHTYANHSGADARALIVCTPAGFERYFARMAAQPRGSTRLSGPFSRSRRSPWSGQRSNRWPRSE
jgi:quercetin dioxygenase-like cupin family protein